MTSNKCLKKLKYLTIFLTLKNEKLNKFGIMENSILSVNVVEAEDLKSADSESKYLYQ